MWTITFQIVIMTKCQMVSNVLAKSVSNWLMTIALILMSVKFYVRIESLNEIYIWKNFFQALWPVNAIFCTPFLQPLLLSFFANLVQPLPIKGRRFDCQDFSRIQSCEHLNFYFTSILFHALATSVLDGLFWLESENFSKIISKKNSMIHC